MKWHRRIPRPGPPGRHGREARGRRWPWPALGAAGAGLAAAGALAAVLAASGVRTARPPSHPAAAAASRTAAARPRPPWRLPVGTPGRYQVAQTGLALVDRSRAGLGPRALPTAVRYPVIPAPGRALARGLFPLVVFAPGYLQCESSYAALLSSWASAGYVVAAVDFPRTSCHASDPDEDDLSNQPADLAYVIRQVLALSGAPRGALAGLVNPAEVAVAGHSDGGDTVAALAAGSCCADPLVRAAIVLAGAEWPPLGGTYFAGASPPVLFVQGDADPVNLPADSIAMYAADRTGPRFYLDLLGAGHFPPYEGGGAPEPVVAQVTLEFLNRYLAGQAGAGAALARAGNNTGTSVLVSGGRPPP